MNEWLAKEAKFQARDLELANAWADEHEDIFDKTFLESISKSFHQNGYLTEAQYKALTTIIEKWRLEEWADSEGLTFTINKKDVENV